MTRTAARMAVAAFTTTGCMEMAMAEGVTITRNGAQPATQGPAQNFTGRVEVRNGFRAEAPARIGGASVSFEAGARTNWHTHPLGQALIVTEGEGRVQHEGGPVQRIGVGDVAWIPPGVKHWHGAAPDAAMTHYALSEALEGNTVTWMEPVTDAQYAAE